MEIYTYNQKELKAMRYTRPVEFKTHKTGMNISGDASNEFECIDGRTMTKTDVEDQILFRVTPDSRL